MDRSTVDRPADGRRPGERQLVDRLVDRLRPGGEVPPPPGDLKLPVPESGVRRCAAGAVQVAQIKAPTGLLQLAICQGGPSKTACTAEELCNTTASWFLCAGGDYQKVVGTLTSIPAQAVDAWIKTCVRESTGTFAPVNAPCNNCNSAAISPVPLSWNCNTLVPTWYCQNETCGAVTSAACNIIGTLQPGNFSYWRVAHTNSPAFRAVCCQ